MVLVGFLVALAAAACFEVGYVLQAIEARRAPQERAMRPSLLASLVRRPLWLGGTVLSVGGMGLQVVALTMAPLTLVQPTIALGLLLLLVLGVRLLGERAGRREMLAALGIVVGVAAIAFEAPPHSDQHAGAPTLVIVLACLLTVVLAPYVLGQRRARWWMLAASTGAADAVAAIAAKLVADELETSNVLGALGFAVVGATALIGGLVSEMTALQRRGATQVAPVILAIQVVVPVMLAPVLGGEDWARTAGGGLVLGAGLLLVGAGAASLGGSRAVAGTMAAEHEAEHEVGGAR